MTVARYTFLPWLRRGIGNFVGTPAGPGSSRAKLTVSLDVKSDVAQAPVPPKDVYLVGPGDIARIVAEQVIRTEPRAGIADYEPNYVAGVEFYDEDFPWRYTPFAPATHRLAPWLLLVLLKEHEFTRAPGPRPLPALTLTSEAKRADIFPVVGEEWAWAHVHLNEVLPGTPAAPDLGALQRTLDGNPDAGYARLLCPRRLQENTRYTAFVVPAFEVGRRAGLDLPVADTDNGATRSWVGTDNDFPIYYEWTFRTGVGGDFESLVRALVPRDMDPRVGTRDMDISHPGYGIATASNPPDDVVGLEGALLAPTTVRKGLVEASDFAAKIEPVLNAPAEARAAGEGDPVVEPPIYGCWHAQVARVSSQPADAGWVQTLNLDPRYRAAAGLGGRVIREHQEEYMRIAWQQIGDVLTVNFKVRRAQLAIKAAYAAYTNTLVALPRERASALVAPAFSKILGSATTLRALVNASRTPRAAFSPTLRKQLRPRGAIARRLLPPDARSDGVARVVAGINEGTLSAAPPRPPAGGATLDSVTAAVAPSAWLTALRSNLGWLFFLLIVLAILLAMFAPPALAVAFLVAAAVAGAVAAAAMVRTRPQAALAAMLSPEGLAPDAILATPAQPAFTYTPETEPTLPPSSAPAPGAPLVAGDSPAAAAMRRALTDFQAALAVRVPEPRAKPALDLGLVHAKAVAAVEPHAAFAARYAPLLRVGDVDLLQYARTRYVRPRGGGMDLDLLREVMNYPDIKLGMYQPLDAISDEYFVPNLGLIPNNTLSLMRTNQPFIESYMVGLNHEFARELLWREYPTDQQGSPFRQFWDVSTYVDREGRDAKTLAEALKDIPPIHQWRNRSALGSHNQRAAEGGASQVVLVVRGDLLKRYPNTVIYAQRAAWGSGPRANRLVLSDETGELYTTNPKDERLKFPLYRARVAPDIHFIGFDLTIEEARGDPRLDETAAARAAVGSGDLGWFFVLQEVVGEPRFGLQVAAPVEASTASRWDNLSWAHLDLSGGEAIAVAKPFKSPVPGPDHGVLWNSNAADTATILYRDPVMCAVHAMTMLRNLKA
jgi:hypothetical protein